MARKGKTGRRRRGPWLRAQDQCWYTTIGRELIKLGTADDAWEDIEERYHAEHSARKKTAIWTVAALVDEFLEFCQKQKAAGTYDWYQRYLKPFAHHIGTVRKAHTLEPDDVTAWVEERFKDCAANTKHGATRCVVRLFNWAIKTRKLRTNPILGLEKPQPTARETAITPEQFQQIMGHVKDQQFRDVLNFYWNTGCRPREPRIIEARHVDGRKVVLDREQSKGKKKRRVIYLNDTAAEIIRRLAAATPDGPIFRNMRGRPWTKDALQCRMKTLRRKTELDLCVYALRHGYITELLKTGCSTTTVAQLTGTSEAMIARVYQHVARDEAFMLAQAAKGGGTVPVVTSLPVAPGTLPVVPQ
jgi:site-specific recombinase XerD